MRLPGSTGQFNDDEIFFDASGTIASATAGQFILPKQRSRSSLYIENISSANMYFEFGGARATAVLGTGTAAGTIASVTVANAGMNYSIAPSVEIIGGGFGNGTMTTPTFSLQGTPDYFSPVAPAGRHAKAHCVMTGSAGALTISSIVIDDPGANYQYLPYIYLRNRLNDPFGCANPYQSSTASGILLVANGGSFTANSTVCTTDQVSVFCGTLNAAFTVKYTL